MKHKICIVTGTRAEYGLLQPLIKKLYSDKMIEIQLVITGSHLCSEFGNTQREIEQNGISVHARIPILLDGDAKADMARATGEAVKKFTDYFEINKPKLLLILGDRYEIFAASTAAALLGIPIAHIHGGETTEGAVDEFLRHSITKMSILHFTACDEYRNRVIQLGEDPERVFNVGALGVENIKYLPELSIEELQESLGIKLKDLDYAIVTLHPVTLGECTAERDARELIQAMEFFPNIKFIITKANADAGGRVINRVWDEEATEHKNWTVVPSLGAKRYLTALKYSKIVIGNSSSGIIEAPAMHIPTINIGDRQKGRMMADSIINCEIKKESIIIAIKKAISPEFQKIAKMTKCPYGDGRTTDRIISKIHNYLSIDVINTKKTFYDVNF